MSGDHDRKNPPYPGLPTTADGSEAVVWVETHISQGACAFPITSSTAMGVQYSLAAANGFENLWGDPLIFLESESEHSSASASEGFALAGGRVTNFTSGQGLVLMKEVLHVISGKRLPIVFNIGARALTSQALNVHAGHDDVMGVGETGWGMLFARNAQEAADLCLISRKVAELTETPFFNIQDGFLTTHTLTSMNMPEEELMREFVGAPGERLRVIFDTKRGIMSGVVQNQDAYMRGKIAQRFYYDQIPGVLKAVMEEFTSLTGRHYAPVASYNMEGAEFAIVALGTLAETAEVTVDYLKRERGQRVGVVHPTSFRPFPGPELVEALRGVEAVAVVERMDNPLGQSNPLTVELKAAFFDAFTEAPGYPAIRKIPRILSGSAGLGGRDVRPGDLVALVDQLAGGRKEYFSLNISHASAIQPEEVADVRPANAFSMRGYSIGGFGSVTTNKVIAKVSADIFGVKVQAYPKYGSEKKGLPTNYYMTLSDEPIRTHCEMDEAEFIPLNTVNALTLGNPLEGLSQGGIVFVQWSTSDPEELWRLFPMAARASVRRAGARVVFLDAGRIAQEESSLPELSIRMQGIVLLGVFLRCVPFRVERGLEDDLLFQKAEEALRNQFGKVSQQVVEENLRCVRRGYQELLEVPKDLMDASAAEEREHFSGKLVAEVMHHGVITCKDEEPLSQVASTMAKEKISALVVVGEGGVMKGILSNTDLSNAAHAQPKAGEAPHLLPHHLMTRDVQVTWPEEELQTAVDRMLINHIHRLVVVKSPEEQQLPVGILSMTDLARTSTITE